MKSDFSRIWFSGIFISIFWGFTAKSQGLDTAAWLHGRVITIQHDTLSGKIQLSQQFIQVFSQQALRVFDPAQIRSYAFVDPDIGIPRFFAKYKITNQVRPEFYEQIVVGEIHFVRQISEIYFYTYEANYLKSNKAEDAWVPRKRQRLQGTYFLWDGHQLRRLGPFKNIMKEVSGPYWNQLSQFTADHNLNYGKPEHQARIINQFNYLSLSNHSSSD